MSTINLDLSQKVDVSCREGDDFDYFIGATNEDGGALDVSSDTIFLFTIKDLKNEPIKIMSNEKRVHSDMTDLVSGFNKLEPSIKKELLPVGNTAGNSLILKNLDVVKSPNTPDSSCNTSNCNRFCLGALPFLNMFCLIGIYYKYKNLKFIYLLICIRCV